MNPQQSPEMCVLRDRLEEQLNALQALVAPYVWADGLTWYFDLLAEQFDGYLGPVSGDFGRVLPEAVAVPRCPRCDGVLPASGVCPFHGARVPEA